MPEAYLKELLQQGKVIPVIGAGVSNAAAGLPGWWGAIEHGLNYARVRNLGETKIAAAFSLLHQNDLTGAAAILKELLNAPSHPFSNWMVDLFLGLTQRD